MLKHLGTLLVLTCLLAMARASRADPANETQIAGAPAFTVAMITDLQGNIFLGSEDQGLAKLAPDGTLEIMTTQQGLGDNSGYALACDTLGRVWVGHLNHGVSVYNGQQWKNYDSVHGPIGDHVSALAISPKDGDVWIATEAGLTRYSQSTDTWKDYTRAQGLPSDQSRGLAFDSDGDLYIASACDGIFIGRAADDFSRWQQVRGAEEMPVSVRGKGLPTNLINAICVTAKNEIWAATTRGVAMSADKGKTWIYSRGKDWKENVAGGNLGKPENNQLKGETDLMADWVETIATDSSGDVWVGFRGRGWQRLAAGKWPIEAEVTQFDESAGGTVPDDDVCGILTTAGKTAYISRYHTGVWRCNMAGAVIEGAPIAQRHEPAPLPRPPAVRSARALLDLSRSLAKLQKVEADPAPGVPGAYLGEDWATQGDWVGRYGRQYMQLCGFFNRSRIFGDSSPGYSADCTCGPHHANATIYSYVDSYNATSGSSLWDLGRGSRTQGEFNDGSFSLANYPLTEDGPDLWVDLTVPAGVHRVSLYFFSSDNHQGINAWRDFVLELRKASPEPPEDPAEAVDLPPGARRLIALEKRPVLARARVSHYWGGVYEQFLLREAGQYCIKIARNHSYCTKLQGVFIDRLTPDPDPPRENIGPLTMGGVDWPLPAAPAMKPDASTTEKAARELWNALDRSWESPGIETIAHAWRLYAFRAAFETESRPGLLAAWRWDLRRWTEDDRQEFNAKVSQAWDRAHPKTPRPPADMVNPEDP